jgi:hypothetical protein
MRVARFGFMMMVVIGFAAGVVGIAAPASAQPGDQGRGGERTNRYAAQVCQHGGYLARVEAETGRAFTTSGDCSSHTAKGGTAGYPVTINATQMYDCPGGGNCWGSLTVTGLGPGTQIVLISQVDTFPVPIAGPITVLSGVDTYQANISCDYASPDEALDAYLSDFTTQVSDDFYGGGC